MLKAKTVLITGGAGFIGSTLARRLVLDNKVVAFDNFRRNALEPELLSSPNFRVVEGDVTDAAALLKVVDETDPTHVVHAAAIAGIDTVIKSPVSTLEVNMLGTANILKALGGRRDIERVVIFSTSEVFGSQAFGSGENTSAVIGAVGEARWTYAVSKLVGEHLAHAYFKELRLPTVVVRPFNVYGPGQVGEGALSTFIKRAIRNEPIEIHGDGTQIRAWCYVDDMVRAVLLSLEHPRAPGESFNIGNSRAVLTIYGLANAVIRILRSSSEISFVRKDYADIELRVPNVAKARELIDFEARIDLEEGVARTADFYREQMHG